MNIHPEASLVNGFWYNCDCWVTIAIAIAVAIGDSLRIQHHLWSIYFIKDKYVVHRLTRENELFNYGSYLQKLDYLLKHLIFLRFCIF